MFCKSYLSLPYQNTQTQQNSVLLETIELLVSGKHIDCHFLLLVEDGAVLYVDRLSNNHKQILI